VREYFWGLALSSSEHKKNKHRVEFVIDGKAQSIEVGADVFLVGRDKIADVQIPESSVSRRHFQVRLFADVVQLVDLGSQNGTYLNSKRIETNSTVTYRPGDLIEVGDPVVQIRIYPREEGMAVSAPTVAVSAPPLPPLKLEATPGTSLSRSFSKSQLIDLEAFKSHQREERVEQIATERSKNEYRDWADRTSRAKEECQEIESRVQELKKTLDHESKKVENERVSLQLVQEQIGKEIDALRMEKDGVEAAVDESRAQLRSLQDQLEQIEDKTRASGAQLHASEHEVQALKVQEQSLEQRVTDLQSTLSQLQGELNHRKIVEENNLKELEAVKRKHHAELESVEAEFKLRTVQAKIHCEETELRKAVLEKDVEILNARKEKIQEEWANAISEGEAKKTQIEEHARDLFAQIEANEEKLAQLKADILDSERSLLERRAQLEKLSRAIDEQDRVFHEKQKEVLVIQEANERLKDEAQSQASLILNQAEDRVRQRELEFEQELSMHKTKIEQDFHRSQAEARTAFELERKQHAERLEQERHEHVKRVDFEIAELKLKAEREIDELRAEARGLEKSRRDFQVREIVRQVLSIQSQPSGEPLEDRLTPVILDVLNDRATVAINADAARRSRDFWKKQGFRLGAVASVALVWALFPQWPSLVRSVVDRKVASSKEDGGVFLDQIKQKGVKYEPTQDQTYKESFSENVLLTEGYVEMKLDEKVSQAWVLELNGFFVKKLELDDRVIVDFASAETLLVTDLLSIREGILPQFVDQGKSRMQEVERSGVERLTGLLKGAENYKAYRVFEKAFYEKFISQRQKTEATGPSQ
jgi:hypothetical protein